MTKASIAIDLDDVLSNHVEAFVNFSNKTYGTNLSIEDYRDNWNELWKVSIKEAKKRVEEFHKPEIVASYDAKKEAKAALKKLKENYDLYIVSVRVETLKDITQTWIDNNFPGIFTDIHLVKHWAVKERTTKADVCKQIGATYLIDDQPLHCIEAADAGIQALLFGDYSWNKNIELKKGMTRCKNWNEVINYFETRTK